MAFTIKYCEGCGERVQPADFENGTAIDYKNQSYCGNCKVEILPLIEKDPEYRNQIRAGRPQIPSGYSTALSPSRDKETARGPRPSSVRLRPPSHPPNRPTSATNLRPPSVTGLRASSGIAKTDGAGGAQRPSSGLRPAVAPPAARRSGSTRAPRPRKSGRLPLIRILSGLTVALLVAVIAAVAVSSGGSSGGPSGGSDDDSGNGGSSKFVNPDSGGGTIDTREKSRWDAIYKEAEEFEKKRLAEVQDPKIRRDEDSAVRDIHDHWEKARLDLKGTPYERLVEESAGKARSQIEKRTRSLFEDLQRRANVAADKGDFEFALSLWRNRFPDALRYSEDWKKKIADEIAAIERKKAEWTPPRDDPVGPGPGPGPGPDNDPSRPPRPVVDGNWKRVQFQAGQDPRIRVEGEEGVIDTRGQGSGINMTILPSGFDTGDLLVQLKMDSGSCAIRGPGGNSIELAGSTFANGSWFEIAVTYAATKVYAWLDGKPVQLSRAERPPGAGELVLSIGTGTLVRFRTIAFRDASGGGSPGPGPAPHGEVVLFDGTEIKHLAGQSGSWKIGEGAIHGENPDEEQTGFIAGQADWGDYRLTFEVKGIEGSEELLCALNITGQQGVGAKLPATYFPDPANWSKVEVVLSGQKVEVKVNGQTMSSQQRPFFRGPVGFFLPRGASCFLRDIRVFLE